MRRAAIGLAFALACADCASTPPNLGGVSSQPAEQHERVTNISHFDLANCFPIKVHVPEPANKEGLVGFLVGARPEIGECLVDPQNRGTNRTTRAAISANVSDQGAEFQATGDNLTPSGAECIRSALKKRGGIDPLPTGAPPASASIDYQHTAGVNPAVLMGVNESSDVVGTIRLAMKGWCDCFEPWRSVSPKTLKAKIALVAGTPTPTEASFDPALDEASGKVQACLAEKLKGLHVKHTSAKLTVPMPFIFLHSGVDQEVSGEMPEVAFLQLDALRTQRASEVALALGDRAVAVGVYDGLVSRYRANPRSVTVKELRERCQGLLRADQAWISALEKQLKHEELTLAYVQKQLSADPTWGEVAAAAKGQVQATQNETRTARQTLQQDEGACPKVTFK